MACRAGTPRHPDLAGVFVPLRGLQDRPFEHFKALCRERLDNLLLDRYSGL